MIFRFKKKKIVHLSSTSVQLDLKDTLTMFEKNDHLSPNEIKLILRVKCRLKKRVQILQQNCYFSKQIF